MPPFGITARRGPMRLATPATGIPSRTIIGAGTAMPTIAGTATVGESLR